MLFHVGKFVMFLFFVSFSLVVFLLCCTFAIACFESCGDCLSDRCLGVVVFIL